MHDQIVHDTQQGMDGKRLQQYEAVRGIKWQAQARLDEILYILNKGEYRESMEAKENAG